MISNFKIIRSFYDALLDFIYPPYCVFCQSLLIEGRDLICDTCYNALPTFPAEYKIRDEIADKLKIPIYISDVKAVWEFNDNVQLIIHQFKYYYKKGLAKKFALYMVDQIKQFDHINLIIPVPLHKRRKQIRGYNQSLLICSALSTIINIPVNNACLQRIKHTKSQTKLNVAQRLKNVTNAFRVVNKKEIKGKSILLVDDVITTGSTINSCAKQLKLNGAEEIFAMSVAKA